MVLGGQEPRHYIEKETERHLESNSPDGDFCSNITSDTHNNKKIRDTDYYSDNDRQQDDLINRNDIL